jgi:hypothetical protein
VTGSGVAGAEVPGVGEKYLLCTDQRYSCVAEIEEED